MVARTEGAGLMGRTFLLLVLALLFLGSREEGGQGGSLLCDFLRLPSAEGALVHYLNFEPETHRYAAAAVGGGDERVVGFLSASQCPRPAGSAEVVLLEEAQNASAAEPLFAESLEGAGTALELTDTNYVGIDLAANQTSYLSLQEWTLSMWVYVPDITFDLFDDEKNSLLLAWENRFDEDSPGQQWKIFINVALTQALEIRLLFDTTNIELLKDNELLAKDQWTHFAFLYRDGLFYLHLDGALKGNPVAFAAKDIRVPQVLMGCAPGEIRTSAICGSFSSYRGMVDEIRLYDYGLTPSEIEALATRNFEEIADNTLSYRGPNSAPRIESASVSALGNETQLSSPPWATQTATVLTGFNFSVQVEDEHPLSYTWIDRTRRGCSVAAPRNLTSPDMILDIASISGNQNLMYTLQVSDGELCSSADLSVELVGDPPQITGIDVPGEDVSLYTDSRPLEYSIKAIGFPSPKYSWFTVYKNGTAAQIEGERGSTLRFWPYEEEVVPDDSSSSSSNSSSSASSSSSSSEGGLKRTTLKRRFKQLKRQAASSEGEELDYPLELIIFGVIHNNQGKVQTDSYKVTVYDTTRPRASSDEDSIVGYVVGPILGFLLLIVVIAAIIIIIIWKIRKPKPIRAAKPDYDEVAYGRMQDSNSSLSSSQKRDLEKLEEMLIESDFLLTRACYEAANFKETGLAKALIYIYAARQMGPQLLNESITRELKLAKQEETLFRSNSMSNKLFSTFCRVICTHFVWVVFAQPVTELNTIAKSSDKRTGDSLERQTSILGTMEMEVDPTKEENEGERAANQLQLRLTTTKLFKGLTKNSHELPAEIREILRHVFDEVQNKFGEDAAFKAVGAFLFLRYLCPSLSAPQKYGLLTESTHPKAQRQLLLITKVLQNLANNTLPGKKEQHMKNLNDFITENQPALRQFYNELINEAGTSKAASIPATVRLNALALLYAFIYENQEKIISDLQQQNAELAESLQTLLEEIGEVQIPEEHYED
ncbi:Ras GTPase activating protein ira2 [Balamuthia mandrillaris]